MPFFSLCGLKRIVSLAMSNGVEQKKGSQCTPAHRTFIRLLRRCAKPSLSNVDSFNLHDTDFGKEGPWPVPLPGPSPDIPPPSCDLSIPSVATPTERVSGAYSPYKPPLNRVPYKCATPGSDQSLQSCSFSDSLHIQIPAEFRHCFAVSEDEECMSVDFDTHSVKLGRTLGHGAFGRVYQAFMRGNPVAMKIIRQDMNGGMRAAPETHLSRFMHPNLVRILGVHERQCNAYRGARYSTTSERDSLALSNVASPRMSNSSAWSRSSTSSDFLSHLTRDQERETWILMEYCDGGSLWDAIKTGSFAADCDGRPCMVRILAVALEIASAMAYLHSAGMIHGDLKPANVLLQHSESSPKGFITKVGDFGLTRNVSDRTHISTISHGTVDHMPPEVLRDGHVAYPTDVFSYGILLWELLAGKKPFKGLNQPSVLVAIVEGVRPTIPQGTPQPFIDLIQDCWKQEWQVRPTFKDICMRLERMSAYAGSWERESRIRAGPVDGVHSERVSAKAYNPRVSEEGAEKVGARIRYTERSEEVSPCRPNRSLSGQPSGGKWHKIMHNARKNGLCV